MEKPVARAEMQMTKQLIQSMPSKWKPEQYTDQYHEALEKIIEEKVDHGGEQPPVPVKKKNKGVQRSLFGVQLSPIFHFSNAQRSGLK